MKTMNMRLWFEAEKRMVYNGSLTFDLSDGAWMWEGRHGTFHSHFGELMYGTGIKVGTKKETQEIFSGDILRISRVDIVTVVWDKQKSGFDTSPKISYANWGWSEAVADHLDRIEIIGNVYENPELLTK